MYVQVDSFVRFSALKASTSVV